MGKPTSDRQLPPGGWVEISLRSRWRATIFLLAIGLPSLFLAAKTLQITLAATLGKSIKLGDIRRALALDPSNPKLHHQLGKVYLYSMEERNPVEASKHFRRATELNPQGVFYWTDLASSCELTGETLCANQAYERVLRLGPMLPSLRWLAANYYLRTAQEEKALGHFQRLLELSPQYAWATFQVCLKNWGDSQIIFRKVLPAGTDPTLKLTFANFLSTQGEAEFAYEIWVQTVAHTYAFPFALAEPYLERLISLGRDQEAVGVWQDLERLGIVHRPATQDRNNLIFNGDFEQAPLNAGLDWRVRGEPYLFVDFSDPTPYHGSRSLRVDFTVSRNEEYQAAYQIVPVVPDQTYQLTAYARSENISSDSGPRLRVVDPACPSCLDVSSDATVGTTAWHPLRLSFSTGAQTRFVWLSVWRARSRTFPTEITGRFWLDAVSLEPVTSPGEKTASNLKP